MAADPGVPTDYPDGRPTGAWTLGEFWAWDFEHYVVPLLRPSTQYHYGISWRHWWGPDLGDVRLDELTLDEIMQAYGAAMELRQPAPSTARAQLSILVAILERARLNRAIDRNPAAGARGPRKVPTEPAALSSDELGRWLDAALMPSGLGGGIWAGALLATAPLTGLRCGELRGLRWRNVDLWERPEGETAGMIHVVEQIESTARRTKWSAPKSAGSHRVVPIPRMLARVLEAQRERVERRALRAGTRGWHDHGLVFPSRKGYAISTMHLFDARKQVAELALLDPLPTFHCLRHTYATRLIEGGMSVPQVAKLLGHINVQHVVSTYFDPGALTHDAAAAAVAASLPPRRSWEGP